MQTIAQSEIQAILSRGENMARRRFQQPKVLERSDGSFYIRPYIDVVKADGSKGREKRVFDLPCKSRNEAKRLARDKMQAINSPDIISLNQMTFGSLLDLFDAKHIEGSGEVGYATAQTYRSIIKNHIRPALGGKMLCEISSLAIQGWMNDLRLNASWGTRSTIKRIISCVFERAAFWDIWKLRNPVKGVRIGRQELVYRHEKWSIEDTRKLIGLLPEDVQILVISGLMTGLRISELLGLKEKHINKKDQNIAIVERYYRGNTSRPKTETSERIIPLGPGLMEKLLKLCVGDPEHYIFSIKTRPEFGRKESLCRNDGTIRRYFLKPAAAKIGLDRKGFGFHELRREAVTEYSGHDSIGEGQTSKLVGHAAVKMTRHYTKLEAEKVQVEMEKRLDKLLGDNATSQVQ